MPEACFPGRRTHVDAPAEAFAPATRGERGAAVLGVELAGGIDAKAIAAAAMRSGLIVNAVTPTTLRLAPSLLVTTDEIDQAVEILRDVLATTIATNAETPS